MEAEELCIAELFGLKGKKNTKKNMKTKPKKDGNVPEDSALANSASDSGATATAVSIDNGGGNDVGGGNDATNSSRIRVSSFDYSAENFFRYIDDIAALCGEDQNTHFDHSEVQRFSSSLTFLREWRDFRYPPKSIRFGYITERCQSSEEKDAGAITLPQFSSATVPQCDVQRKEHPVDTKLQESRCRDFVMCVGGPVWALDWCPQIDERPDCSAKCEFVAVATHPPGSSYHKMGAPLTGRGVIQIWCLLNIREQDEEKCYSTNKGKKRPKKDKSTKVTRPRGRPRKNPKGKVIDNTNSETPQYVPALDVQFPERSSELPASDGVCWNDEEILPIIDMSRREHKIIEASSEKSAQIKRPRGRPKKSSKEATVCSSNSENQAVQAHAVQVPEDSAEINFSGAADGNRNESALQQCSVAKQKQTKKAASACNTVLETHVKSSRLKANHRDVGCNEDVALLTQVENDSSQPHGSSAMGNVVAPNSISGNVTMPKLVCCLAHNGKVAWDVKWQPPNMYDPVSKHRMGYLAVLLGNGSLEVWEVPLPRVLREIYKHRDGTDPRFIKLAPVFKCSMLKRGGKQSIPLTVEWSVMPPHDYLLVGCHDGMVALWKFSIKTSSKCDDTKPVLCFRGDAAPIRAVAWAPFEGDPESFNIIVTAGHEGLKFWDLRNPFRPLRSMQPVPRNIYSLDWLPKPSCIIMSFEDGTMKTISLVKVANEFPVNGKTYNGKRQPWLHTYSLSSSAIWNVQVSRNTGMVAYCGADGTVFRFQLTTKAVEIGDSHHTVPFFLCGSVTEEDSTLVINSSVSTRPFPLKRSIERVRYAQSFRDLLRKSATSEMAKTSNPDSQTLGLCGDDDLGMASECEEALSSVKQPKRRKLTGSDKKKSAESNSLVNKDDAPTSNLGDDTEKADFGHIPEVFPSKWVALHRVRWNMNKGSERWLCFGGAGGIVRCQEFVYTDIDRRWALKR
ncbi:hypothetical protein HN51_005036 [Arachis hypogaea]|uniref:Uncharacterized protein n=2 Tax=Arachis hypogaea TaxID=3818 RepID=A0A445DGC7_ARAHY|nr:uncharacterized protein LOC112796884 isoform X1 [Arachis hypogaea]QHO38722.1 putative WD40 domain containing protein [Arachis hypogaea]RYR62248.1 hypothetical protein Ahy_A04g019680 [Arachis hypogaea]